MRYLIAVTFAWMLTAALARAQEAEVPTVPYEGVHLFCHVLHTKEMTPIASFPDAINDPKHSTIIIFGDPAFLKTLENADQRLKTFLSKGGSLLIATDHELIARALSVRFTGGPVSAPDKKFAYRGEVACPFLNYLLTDQQSILRLDDGRWVNPTRDVRDHPLLGLLHKGIATNFPRGVRSDRDDKSLEVLLEYPPGVNQWNHLLPYMIGSGKNARPHGRALYIAGHGMFINAMMAQTDNDNFPFAVHAVRWLREGPKDGPEHSKVLFYVNGEIIRDFDMKFTPPAPRIPIPEADALSRLVRGLENERFFQKLLADALGDYMDRFIAIVRAIVTFIVLIYGAKKFMEGRHHFETTVPILLGPPLAAKTPGEERQQAVLRKGNFWEPSRRLALDWLRQEFDVTPDRWLAGIDARFQANGAFWSRWRLKRQADFVLQLARTANGARLSRHQFFVLIETLRELSAAAKDGRLALLVEGKNVKQTRPVRSTD